MDEVFGVFDACGFVAGVHGKLGEAYVCSVDGDVSVADIAECGTAAMSERFV